MTMDMETALLASDKAHWLIDRNTFKCETEDWLLENSTLVVLF